MKHYILNDNGEPVEEPDVLKWARWLESSDAERRVGQFVSGTVTVSTVFLGLDHNHTGNGSPVLWETMVFGLRGEDYQVRYATLEEARAGHESAVKMVRGREC